MAEKRTGLDQPAHLNALAHAAAGAAKQHTTRRARNHAIIYIFTAILAGWLRLVLAFLRRQPITPFTFI